MNIPTPSEPGIELPDEPGLWTREGWNILVNSHCSWFVGFRFDDCEIKGPLHELPRGGWLRATAPAADPLRPNPNTTFAGVCNRVCRDLPEGWTVRIDLEYGSGGVALQASDGSDVDFGCDFEGIDAELDTALNCAITLERNSKLL